MKFLIAALMVYGTLAHSEPIKWATEDMKTDDNYSPAGAVNNSIHADYAPNGGLLLKDDHFKDDNRLVPLTDLSPEDRAIAVGYFKSNLDYVLEHRAKDLTVDKLEYIGVIYNGYVVGLIQRLTGRVDRPCHLLWFMYVPAGNSQPMSAFYNSCY